MPPLRSAHQDVLSDEEITQILNVYHEIKDQLAIVVPFFAGYRSVVLPFRLEVSYVH